PTVDSYGMCRSESKCASETKEVMNHLKNMKKLISISNSDIEKISNLFVRKCFSNSYRKMLLSYLYSFRLEGDHDLCLALFYSLKNDRQVDYSIFEKDKE